jgi:hypothetical protein
VRVLIQACLAGCLCIGACREAPVRQGVAGAVDTSATGVIRVVSSPEGSWEGSTGWTIRERVRIGEMEGSGPEVFGGSGAIDIDSAGKVVVWDAMARELRTFGPAGEHVGTVGRRGAGPQEFEDVIGMARAPDGSLWLVDAGNARYARVSGGKVEQTAARPVATFDVPWLGGFDAAGNLYDQASVPVGTEYAGRLIRMRPPGAPSDSLPLAGAPGRAPSMGGMTFPLPFAPRRLWAFDPRGFLVTAVSDQYALTVLDLDGDTAMVVERPVERRRLPPRQQDSVRRYVRELQGRFGVTVEPGMAPAWESVLRWIAVDDAGFLWVCATGLEPCGVLDVFQPDGRYLGAVRLPSPVTWGKPAVRGSTIAYASEGPEGAPIVLVADILGRGHGR